MKYIPPEKIAEEGDKIYNDMFKSKYEGHYDGMFLSIDIDTKEAHLGKYPEDALGLAEKKNPDGRFYLVKIGKETAFHVGYIGERYVGMEGGIQQTA
ncbi:MAG: hypothetical protein OXF60_09615 [Gammaproteobacteria bacterium]|nr:hypothetical protein [Gammaproteobacteria bacterium]